MDAIKGIIKFQTERLLDKQDFAHRVEVINILEELFETLGLQSEYARHQAVEVYDKNFSGKLIVTKEELVDCFCDIIVYSIGALLKLKVDPVCALQETAKEINSRVGKIIDGKFIKDKSQKAQANWYKANYNKCINNE